MNFRELKPGDDIFTLDLDTNMVCVRSIIGISEGMRGGIEIRSIGYTMLDEDAVAITEWDMDKRMVETHQKIKWFADKDLFREEIETQLNALRFAADEMEKVINEIKEG